MPKMPKNPQLEISLAREPTRKPRDTPDTHLKHGTAWLNISQLGIGFRAHSCSEFLRHRFEGYCLKLWRQSLAASGLREAGEGVVRGGCASEACGKTMTAKEWRGQQGRGRRDLDGPPHPGEKEKVDTEDAGPAAAGKVQSGTDPIQCLKKPLIAKPL